MVAPVVTFRPNQPTTVWLPFRAGGANYRLLKDIRGPGTREAHWNPRTKLFEVPRTNGDQLVDGLIDEFGSVRVTIYGHSTATCVRECWTADPRTAWDCVCKCAGSNHGSGFPMGREVAEGLSVENQYTVSEFVVDESGWTLVQ